MTGYRKLFKIKTYYQTVGCPTNKLISSVLQCRNLKISRKLEFFLKKIVESASQDQNETMSL